MARSAKIPLDTLVALCDEIVAITRSGVPLEHGLVQLGRDMPGRLGKVASQLGQRLEAGEDLADALAEDDVGMPPAFVAIVRAGVTSGRLAAALEAMTATARRVAHLRRVIGLSMIYPLFVFLLASVLMIYFILNIAPNHVGLRDALRVESGGFVQLLMWANETLGAWMAVIPLAVIAGAALWWYGATRHALSDRRHASTRLWLTPLARVVRLSRLASFTQTLALMLDNKVPMDQALLLASESAGEPALEASAHRLSERIRQGRSATAVGADPAGIPPLVQWLLTTPTYSADVGRALHRVADGHFTRVCEDVDWIQIYLPIFLAATIGGIATLVYGVAVFGSWYELVWTLTSTQ